MTSFALNTLDFTFNAIETMSEINRRRYLHQCVLALATVAAIFVGVANYAWTAAQLFWEEHGETIQLSFLAFVDKTENAIQVAYDLGVAFCPVANYWVARTTDSLFFLASDL